MNGSSESTSTAMRWQRVEVCRSAACLIRTRGPCSQSGAPTNRPQPGGQELGHGAEGDGELGEGPNGRDGIAQKRKAPYGSSSMITKPYRSASSARWRRRSRESVPPDGFWKFATT